MKSLMMNKRLCGLLLLAVSCSTAMAEPRGGGYNDDPIPDRKYSESDPYSGSRYDTGKAYPNAPNRSNSTTHAMGGESRTGANDTVTTDDRNMNVRMLGSNERPTLNTNSVSSPLMYVRQGAGNAGIPNGQVIEIFPGHPEWPTAASGEYSGNAWTQGQNCTVPCCSGRSVVVNGQCPGCPNPADPPRETYICQAGSF